LKYSTSTVTCNLVLLKLHIHTWTLYLATSTGGWVFIFMNGFFALDSELPHKHTAFKSPYVCNFNHICNASHIKGLRSTNNFEDSNQWCYFIRQPEKFAFS